MVKGHLKGDKSSPRVPSRVSLPACFGLMPMISPEGPAERSHRGRASPEGTVRAVTEQCAEKQGGGKGKTVFYGAITLRKSGWNRAS